MRNDDSIASLADVQRLLLPDNPDIRAIEHAVHYQPADIAAGDYYDLMSLTAATGGDATASVRRDTWGLMVGDVSGHGPAAAMEAVQFDAILRTYRGDEEPRGPAGALTYANRYFFSRRARRHFLTVFGAVADPENGVLKFVSAGHPPAILKRGGSVHKLGEDGDIPLGVLREHRYRNSEHDWAAGDILIAYTDGLIEAVDAGGVQFGIDRVADIIAKSSGSAADIVRALRDALIAHQASPIGRDDQTIVAVRQLA